MLSAGGEMSRRRLAATAQLLSTLLACSCSTRNDAQPESGSAAAERELRQKPVAEIAPFPIPAQRPSPLPGATATSTAGATFPLVGTGGDDEYGYPRQYVDRAALRSLLFHRRFTELTEAVERLQTAFEGDLRKEYWPNDAAEELGTGEAKLLPLLDAWAEASPKSFGPYLARGTHWVRRAYERRGGKWAAETPEANFASMGEALARALPDLKRATKLRPKLVAAMRQQLNAFLPLPHGDRANKTVIARALTVCPSCFQIRVTYLHTLTPRWGGSYPAMRRFIRQRADRTNRRMRLLPGYLDLDRAEQSRSDKEFEKELAATERACALGEHWEFLLARAGAEVRLGNTAAALSDLDRAAVLRPGYPDVLFERAYTFGKARRWEDAGRDLRAGIQVDPTHWRARSIFDTVVKGLVYEGWQRRTAGDREGALRIYDLAAELAPNNREVQGRRALIIAGDEAADAGANEGVQGVPDDFRAVQQLDYRLARKGEFGRVVALWNDFLARHPDHGPAYLERGGALFNLHRLPEARADAQKACDLGVSEGCVRAKQFAVSR